MNKNIYLITLFILIISGIFACKNQQNEQSQYVPVIQFDPNRDAAKDMTDAIVEAKRTNKRILLDVGGDWCIWCHKLDSFFRENQDINEFLHENFIVVKINYSKENKNEAVLSQYPKVAGYPHLFVLDSDGKLLHSQNTGDLESGDHHDREKVFSFLKTWTPSSK
jgi:thioredoxin-related protein